MISVGGFFLHGFPNDPKRCPEPRVLSPEVFLEILEQVRRKEEALAAQTPPRFRG